MADVSSPVSSHASSHASTHENRGGVQAAGARSSLASRWGLGCLLLALLWAPLPLGSNRVWSLALLAALVWLGLAGLAAGALWNGESWLRAPGLRTGRWLLVLAASYCAWVSLQLGLGQPAGWLWVTEDAYATRQYLLRSLTYAGAMLLCLWAVNSAARARWVLGAMLVSALLQAMLAVSLHASGAEYRYLFESFDQGQRATGTFINPDHLAGYMELGLSAGLGMMLAMLGGGGDSSRRWQERLAAAAAFLMSPKMLVRLSLVVMVIALVLTRSRMGNGAFVISMLLVGLLVAFMSVRLRKPAIWLVASMVIIDLIVIGQWVGLDKVAQRMRGTAEASSQTVASFGLTGTIPPPREESLMDRLQVPLAATPLIAQRPVAGFGGGSFGLAFPPIKPADAYGGFWDQTHNDYLQVAVETGLVGLALWFAMGLTTGLRALPLLKDGQSSLNRGIGVASLMALSCLGLHSVVDFNLQIPANALTFAVLLSLVWVAPALPAESRKGKPVLRRRKAFFPEDDE